ncbi:hypothetical protein M885DRAFT_525426 [Pelagophyceae sp. CCMP2097]|nr:hypothetical protein M885DRAFT_525426 [Pelagophyceae sp. CCMP2097]
MRGVTGSESSAVVWRVCIISSRGLAAALGRAPAPARLCGCERPVGSAVARAGSGPRRPSARLKTARRQIEAAYEAAGRLGRHETTHAHSCSACARTCSSPDALFLRGRCVGESGGRAVAPPPATSKSGSSGAASTWQSLRFRASRRGPQTPS